LSTIDNKKLIETIFAGAAAGDRTLLVGSLADDVTMRVTGQNSWSQTFKGKEALLRDLYGYLGTLVAEGRRTIAQRFIADGDHVVVEAVGEMRTKAGVPYNNEYCLIYRLKDGKIVEFREYCDSALTEKILGKYPATRTPA
jgi:ketosteroid isomerase-like protein